MTQSAVPLDALPGAAWISDATARVLHANEPALALRLQPEHHASLAPHIAQTIATQEARILHEATLPGLGVCSVRISPLRDVPHALVMLQPQGSQATHGELQTRTDLSAHMAASLAHEIRNPLLSIKGAAQLLEDAASADDKPLAQLIITEAARIEALMAALDPLSPTPEAGYGPVNIHEVLEYVRQAAEASFARHATFVLDYDPSLPPLHGMQTRLVQLVMNLVKNAAEATAEISGAHITLSTRYSIGTQRKRPGGKALPIHVSIADNGVGIAEELRAQLFTPFVTSKAGGRGLGLSLAGAIMAQHGALLDWESTPGKGTIFHLYFAAA